MVGQIDGGGLCKGVVIVLDAKRGKRMVQRRCEGKCEEGEKNSSTEV